MGFMADKVALKHAFILMVWVCLGSISALMLDTHLFINQRRNTFSAKDRVVIYLT